MSVCIVRAESTAGQSFELNRIPSDEATARRVANRLAVLLAIFGDPAAWAGSRVIVVDAEDGRLVSAARIVPRGVGARNSH